MRENVRRLLAAGVLFTILLPMVIAMTLGLGALLGALGDENGAHGCGRIGLALGGAWFLALAATATAAGILTLEERFPPGDDRTAGPERDSLDKSPSEE